MAHGGDIYRNKVNMDFSVNLNPLGTPKEVLEAASNSIVQASAYPDIEQDKVRSEIGAMEGLEKDCVYAGNGASELIMAIVRAVNPKSALLFEPGFSGYEHALNAVHCRITRCFLSEDNGFKLSITDPDTLFDNIDISFICDPANPTGLCVDDTELIKLLDAAKKSGTFICLDESFLLMSEKAIGREKMTASELIKKYDNLFIVRSLTKVLAMPGIRMGYALSNLENVKKLAKQLPEWNVSVVSEAAIIAGIRMIKEKDFILKTVDEIRTEREFLLQELKALGISAFHSDTAFILFKGPEFLYERLLDKGVLIRDCSDYPGLGKGFYRIAVKSHEDNERLIQILRDEIAVS